MGLNHTNKKSLQIEENNALMHIKMIILVDSSFLVMVEIKENFLWCMIVCIFVIYNDLDD